MFSLLVLLTFPDVTLVVGLMTWRGRQEFRVAVAVNFMN